jgi:hypothetical protein
VWVIQRLLPECATPQDHLRFHSLELRSFKYRMLVNAAFSKSVCEDSVMPVPSRTARLYPHTDEEIKKLNPVGGACS